MTKKWPFSPFFTLLFMIPLVSFYSFALDLYIPLLPSIQQEMGVSRITMQYTNSLFMLFCGIGQLVFGPLSDRYGRRPIVLVSCNMLLIANITCAFAPHIYILLLGRILQAIGACGCYLVAFATIRDIYPDENKSAEMFSYLNIANSLSAIFAPSLGSFIGSYLTWHAIFYTQVLTTALTTGYCMAFFTETTSPLSSNKFTIRSTLQNYLSIFKHINYQVYTLPAACGMGSFFAFYCVSPYLYQEVLGLSSQSFSLFYGTCGMTFFIGSYLCGLSVSRYGILVSLCIGLFIHQIGCLGILSSYYLFSSLSLTFLHLSVIFLILGASFMVGAGIGGTMAPFAHMAGSAFAMISCYKFLLSDITGDVTVWFYDSTPVSLGSLLLALNLICCLVLFLCKDKLMRAKNTKTTRLATIMDQTGDHIL